MLTRMTCTCTKNTAYTTLTTPHDVFTIPIALSCIVVRHMDPDDPGIHPDRTIQTRAYPPQHFDDARSGDTLRRKPGAHMLTNVDDQFNDLIYCAELDRYTNFVPHLNGRYLSSNVNITVFNSDGEVVSVPVGSE